MFAAHSKTGTMNKDEMRNLLTEVKRQILGDQAVLREENLDAVMAKMDKNGDGEVLREHVLPAIKKYKALLAQSEELSEMFRRHDKDVSGGLDEAQVLTMLQEVGRLEKLSFIPDEEDAAWVIKNCDKNQSGSIMLDELKPAISSWLRYERDPQNARQRDASSSMCSLL